MKIIFYNKKEQIMTLNQTIQTIQMMKHQKVIIQYMNVQA
jgi:hypothetical protein